MRQVEPGLRNHLLLLKTGCRHPDLCGRPAEVTLIGLPAADRPVYIAFDPRVAERLLERHLHGVDALLADLVGVHGLNDDRRQVVDIRLLLRAQCLRMLLQRRVCLSECLLLTHCFSRHQEFAREIVRREQ